MFKSGEIVIVDGFVKNVSKGKIGKVIVESNYGSFVGVDFGKGFYGHDLDGKNSTKTCWWIEESCLKKYKNSNLDCY